MGKDSRIEWTHHTFNPWWGCAKVSPGCANCYAERDSKRYGFNIWGVNASRRFFGDKHWAEPLKWNRDAEQAGQRRRVFCASMADVFEDRRDLDQQRDQLWTLIERTTWLDWLLLTKRPEMISFMMPMRWRPHKFGRPPRNIWFGISAENQDEFDRRWPVLEHFGRMFNAAKLFISAEPLLGPINMEIALREDDAGDEDSPLWVRAVDWVIVGGESGPKARPMHPAWARSIRDQCVEAEIPFHFKQWGEWISKIEIGEFTKLGWQVKSNWLDAVSDKEWGCLDIHGKYCEGTTTWNGRQNDPRDDFEVTIYRVGKKAGGRLLDGRTWDEFPDSN